MNESEGSACRHPSQDTSHLILHCPATDSAPLTRWRLSVSLRPLVQVLGSCPASGTSMVLLHAPIPRKWSSNQQQQRSEGKSCTSRGRLLVGCEQLRYTCWWTSEKMTRSWWTGEPRRRRGNAGMRAEKGVKLRGGEEGAPEM